jgi:protein TonB
MMSRFVVFSLALHLLAAGVIYQLLPQQDAAPPLGTLAVSLQKVSTATSENISPPSPGMARSNAAKPARTRHAATQDDHAQATESTQPAEADQQATATPIRQSPGDDDTTGTTQARAAEADMLDSLRSEVYRALHANFSYPRRARQRGWEGTVVISLRILADGQLADIRVAGSSGISTLDRAAVASLRKVRVARLDALMQGRELDLTIPVEYRLTDS